MTSSQTCPSYRVTYQNEFYGCRHSDPNQIRDNVMIQHPRRNMFGPSIEEQCWEKYNDLFQAMGERMVEDEIMRVIAEFTEGLLRGIRGLRS